MGDLLGRKGCMDLDSSKTVRNDRVDGPVVGPSLGRFLDACNSLNGRLNRIMPLLTPFGVLLGLLLGLRVSWMKPAVNWLFGLMTFLGAMKISAKDMLASLRRPVFFAAFALGGYVLMPLVAFTIGSMFFPGDKELLCGYVLLRATPSAVVCTIWAGIYSGNMAISIAMLVLDSFLSPFMTPLLLRLYTGASVAVDSVGMMKSLCFMVLLPSLLALVFNHFKAPSIKKVWTPATNPLSKLLMVLVIMINTSQVSQSIIENASWKYVAIGIANSLMVVIGFSIGFACAKLMRLDRDSIVSVTFGVSMRNISAALVLAISFMPPAASLPVIFGIIFQQSLVALMGNLAFGEKHRREGRSKKG